MQTDHSAQAKNETENRTIQIDDRIFQRQFTGPTGENFRTCLVQVKIRSVTVGEAEPPIRGTTNRKDGLASIIQIGTRVSGNSRRTNSRGSI